MKKYIIKEIANHFVMDSNDDTDYYIVVDPEGFDYYGEGFELEEAERLCMELNRDMKKLFIIQDWAGNRLFPANEFDTIEDGWDFIYENIPEDSEDDGTYDDVYVIEK